MANQRLVPGYPFAAFIDETGGQQRQVGGEYVNETGAGGATNYTLNAAAGSFVLTGEAALFPVRLSLAAAQGVFVFTGEDATFSKTGHAAYVLTAQPGLFGLIGWPALMSANIPVMAVSFAMGIDAEGEPYTFTIQSIGTA